jgi:hypothetical protein
MDAVVMQKNSASPLRVLLYLFEWDNAVQLLRAG